MDCDQARAALSAVLDSEDPGTAWAAVQAHLDGCDRCRRWQDAAHELTRRARLQRGGLAPAPPEALVAAARSAGRSPAAWWRSPPVVRAGLTVVAATQLALSVPLLFLGHDREAPVHVAHEMGSLDVAVAVGLLVAARRPARALGMLALVGTAAVLLVATAGMDLAAGRTTWADEVPHLLVLAGWLLLRRLARLSPAGGERPTAAVALLGGLRRGLAAATGRVLGPEVVGRPGAAALQPGTAGMAASQASCDRLAS